MQRSLCIHADQRPNLLGAPPLSRLLAHEAPSRPVAPHPGVAALAAPITAAIATAVPLAGATALGAGPGMGGGGLPLGEVWGVRGKAT